MRSFFVVLYSTLECAVKQKYFDKGTTKHLHLYSRYIIYLTYIVCFSLQQLNPQRTSEGPKKWTNEEVNTRLRRFVWAQ